MSRRLVVVSPTFHPEPIGTPVYATDLVRWFHRRDWDVEVVTGQPYYPRFERHPGFGRATRHDSVDGNIPVLRLPTIVPKHGRAIWRAAADLNFAVQAFLRSTHRRAAAVLSISPGVPTAVAAGRALTARGGRHVALVHDVQSGLAGSLGMVPGALERPIAAAERWGLERADHVTALTQEMETAIRDLGVRRPTSVTPLWATVPADPAFVADGEVSVQYSGNFGEKQGVDALDSIALELRSRAPHIRMLLRGAGPRFDSLKQRLRTSNVGFEDPVPDTELAAALARSPIHLVLASPGTGSFALPSKIINILATGGIIVATAEAGSPVHRLAGHLTGLHVVPIGDAHAVVDTVLRLAGDPSLRKKRLRSQRQAAAEFDRDRILEQLEKRLLQ